MKKPIYFITSVYGPEHRNRNHKEQFHQLRHSRCWGWWPTLKEARKSVKCNDCDMHETDFEYLVIESVSPYMLAAALDTYTKEWYRWHGNNDTGKWKAIKDPKWSKSIIGYGIG